MLMVLESEIIIRFLGQGIFERCSASPGESVGNIEGHPFRGLGLGNTFLPIIDKRVLCLQPMCEGSKLPWKNVSWSTGARI